MMNVDDRGGLTAQVGWFGLRVGNRLTLFCIRQMNRLNSRNESVINTVVCSHCRSRWSSVREPSLTLTRLRALLKAVLMTHSR